MVWARYPRVVPEAALTIPDEGACRLYSIFSNVDFPAPFLPTNPILSRGFIIKETPFSKSNPPKETHTSFTETIFPQEFRVQK
jgi:hypothetical protein